MNESNYFIGIVDNSYKNTAINNENNFDYYFKVLNDENNDFNQESLLKSIGKKILKMVDRILLYKKAKNFLNKTMKSNAKINSQIIELQNYTEIYNSLHNKIEMRKKINIQDMLRYSETIIKHEIHKILNQIEFISKMNGKIKFNLQKEKLFEEINQKLKTLNQIQPYTQTLNLPKLNNEKTDISAKIILRFIISLINLKDFYNKIEKDYYNSNSEYKYKILQEWNNINKIEKDLDNIPDLSIRIKEKIEKIFQEIYKLKKDFNKSSIGYREKYIKKLNKLASKIKKDILNKLYKNIALIKIELKIISRLTFYDRFIKTAKKPYSKFFKKSFKHLLKELKKFDKETVINQLKIQGNYILSDARKIHAYLIFGFNKQENEEILYDQIQKMRSISKILAKIEGKNKNSISISISQFKKLIP